MPLAPGVSRPSLTISDLTLTKYVSHVTAWHSWQSRDTWRDNCDTWLIAFKLVILHFSSAQTQTVALAPSGPGTTWITLPERGPGAKTTAVNLNTVALKIHDIQGQSPDLCKRKTSRVATKIIAYTPKA